MPGKDRSLCVLRSRRVRIAPRGGAAHRREFKVEGRALPWNAVESNTPALLLYNRFADAQAQPGSAGGTPVRPVRLGEFLKDAPPKLGGDTGSMIRDPHAHHVVLHARRQPHRSEEHTSE